ncbi:RNA polymerase II complex subunit Rpb11 [Schizosaccharomyces japonicus yFS275]|uniref:RNA polymerase II complex subunit Rpb11 n=1 Tax=Schizosaccharomyces japonicus (strain yFS275 / FY16936) TaxID=402676 RepID=B6K818_SCHJY|nr:RNA polymerase II complex subunit Rpb11 [Schizosaccharomyces japonicus yFS275]EEB09672.1 RNA polymerase II complex subunit Rpb11 [Schizosaccharomyces japonicus yFS275]
MNQPERYELIELMGLPKVTYELDTKSPNTANITIEKEDHTLANMLRTQLLYDERVVFAGYRVPHPLNHNFILRVQTTEECSPKQAIIDASKSLITVLEQLKVNFTREWELKKISDEGVEMDFS